MMCVGSPTFAEISASALKLGTRVYSSPPSLMVTSRFSMLSPVVCPAYRGHIADMRKLLSEIEVGETPRGRLHECQACGARFFARADALFCSDKCRKRFRRRAPRTERPDA